MIELLQEYLQNNFHGSGPHNRPVNIGRSLRFITSKDKSHKGRISHYSDDIMGVMASKIISLTVVYSTVYSGTDKRKHQSSASLTSVRGIHRSPVKGPVTRKMFLFDDAIMFSNLAVTCAEASWTLLKCNFVVWKLKGQPALSKPYHIEAEIKWPPFTEDILKCIFVNENV